jgi:diaminohydroxyphosphoribosylaminopyrimidine deaminase/5-amino-6-(5-phosphoribosylamino)uracil reductase
VFSASDELAMRRALELAARGLETTDPNPRVGCVIARGESIVGEGWHRAAGDAHAEVHALAASGRSAAGATAYVTLEPCNHTGRTPPCVDALIEARVARVVYAIEDPNPRVHGGGAARLRAAGIAVDSGLCAAEARALNPGFLKRMQRGMPWVRLKTAASLDGRAALASGASRWITGEGARADVHAWRARSSAVLTGIGTVLADDPRLDVRRSETVVRAPARIVVDSQLRTPVSARLFDAPGGVIILHAVESPSGEALGSLRARGARTEFIASAGRVDLAAALRRLAELEMNELWVEAGPRLAGALLAQRLVDEWIHYVAPSVLGEGALPFATLPPLAALADALTVRIVEVTPLGADLRLTLRPERG